MVSYQLLLCTLAIAVNGIWGDGEQSSFLAMELVVPNEIPSECQDIFKLPGQAISNVDVDWDFLCSGKILDSCLNVLKYTFVMEFDLGESQTLLDIINAFTLTGADYICRLNRTTIENIMDNGGASCLSASNTQLGYCYYVGIIRFETTNDQEAPCSTMDYAYHCAMDAIESCNDATDLKNLWSSYYTKVITSSKCVRYTRFRYNTATTNNLYVPLIFVIFLGNYFVNIS